MIKTFREMEFWYSYMRPSYLALLEGNDFGMLAAYIFALTVTDTIQINPSTKDLESMEYMASKFEEIIVKNIKPNGKGLIHRVFKNFNETKISNLRGMINRNFFQGKTYYLNHNFLLTLLKIYQKKAILFFSASINLHDFFLWLKNNIFYPFNERGDLNNNLQGAFLVLNNMNIIQLQNKGDVGTKYTIGLSDYDSLELSTNK